MVEKECRGTELAEARGFEPPVPVSEYNDLANRRLKPLGHASVAQSYKQALRRYQASVLDGPPQQSRQSRDIGLRGRI